MKAKTFIVVFALAIVLSITAGVLAQDFTDTWDENTVLTVFNDLDISFPDMFADTDSDFLWTNNNIKPYESHFPKTGDAYTAKAPLDTEYGATTMTATYDPCGDGLIKYDITITKAAQDKERPWTDLNGTYYYGDESTSYIRDFGADLHVNSFYDSSSSYKLDVKTCESTGGDGCHSVTFKKITAKNDLGKNEPVYQAHLKGYLTVPAGLILYDPAQFDVDYVIVVRIDFSTYMTSLWPLEDRTAPDADTGYVWTAATTLDTLNNMNVNRNKDYCQNSLSLYDAFGYSTPAIRAKYDENTGEARLQVVIQNYQPNVRKQNYVIPAEIFAFTGDPYKDEFIETFDNNQRITDYTCNYTVYNPANAAPRTDYCKFGEGIAIPDHGMVRIDFTIDHLSGDILRAAAGDPVSFRLRLGGYTGSEINYSDINRLGTEFFTVSMERETGTYHVPFIEGKFEPIDLPCPKVSRMQVLDPLNPFMTFYKVLKSDNPITPSGIYGAYENGLWGMYQKCGKYAYMMVRLKNDGLDHEIINLDHTAVAVNNSTPMKWNWIMTTITPEKGSRIDLEAGEEVILIGRAKLTDIPYQMNADIAMIGAVNFSDFGFYITGKVYSDHNNTRCVAPPK